MQQHQRQLEHNSYDYDNVNNIHGLVHAHGSDHLNYSQNYMSLATDVEDNQNRDYSLRKRLDTTGTLDAHGFSNDFVYTVLVSYF